jgi:hypothetical protein
MSATCERSTVLAPPPVSTSRPTALPPTDGSAVAGEMKDTAPPPALDEEVMLKGLRLRSKAYIPLDTAVPRLVPGASDVTGLSHRARFLLLHVDGHSTLSQLSRGAMLPEAEVIGIFLELLGCGAVELAMPDVDAVMESGVFRLT